jgi:hypothetical protein
VKRITSTIVLLLVLAFPLLQMPKAYSAELTAPEKTLTFLTDVVKLDMTKYTVTLVSNWVDYPPHWGGLAEEDVTYNLDWADESRLYVTCKFRENMLYSCSLEVLKGSPIFVQPSTNIVDEAKSLLEGYQAYSGASYPQEMCDMLDKVDVTKEMTVTSSNIKLTTSSQNVQHDPAMEAIIHTYFEWMYTVNSVDAPQNVLRATFENGIFKFFRDDWSLFKIGSTSAISQEEAINLAMDAAEDYTLQIYLGDNTLTDVEFNLVDEPVTAELFMYPRETLTVYPFWRIEVYFDKYYYSAYGIQVGIWADTKQIEYCKSLSGLGPVAEEDPIESSTEQSLTSENDGTASSMNMYIITATAIIALVGATLLIHFRKIRKTTKKPETIMPEEST